MSTPVQSGNLEAQLQALQQEAQAAIASTDSLDELEQLRIKYLGKKGSLSKVLGGMGKLSAEERPQIGALANEVKEAVQRDLEARRTELQNAAIAAQIESETLDVTMPGVFRQQGQGIR